MPPVLTTMADRLRCCRVCCSINSRASRVRSWRRRVLSKRSMRLRGDVTSRAGDGVNTVSTGGRRMPMGDCSPSLFRMALISDSTVCSAMGRRRFWRCWISAMRRRNPAAGWDVGPAAMSSLSNRRRSSLRRKNSWVSAMRSSRGGGAFQGNRADSWR